MAPKPRTPQGVVGERSTCSEAETEVEVERVEVHMQA